MQILNFSVTDLALLSTLIRSITRRNKIHLQLCKQLIRKDSFDYCKRLHVTVYEKNFKKIAPQMKILIKWGVKIASIWVITQFFFWSQGEREGGKNLDFNDHQIKVWPLSQKMSDDQKN